MNGCIKTLDAPQARRLMLHTPDHLLFDLRSRADYEEAHLPGALHAAAADIAGAVARQQAQRDTPILLYCRTGVRSRAAAAALMRLGYTQVYDMGGFGAWPYEVAGRRGR